MPRTLDLRYDTAFDFRTPDAYERLLTDVIRGDQTLFMRRDEVEAAWAWIDPIIEGWRDLQRCPASLPRRLMGAEPGYRPDRARRAELVRPGNRIGLKG